MLSNLCWLRNGFSPSTAGHRLNPFRQAKRQYNQHVDPQLGFIAIYLTRLLYLVFSKLAKIIGFLYAI
jgi:hypothetical protein